MKFSTVCCFNGLTARFRNVMEEIDLVLVGAEGVCKNGGIVNKVSW